MTAVKNDHTHIYHCVRIHPGIFFFNFNLQKDSGRHSSMVGIVCAYHMQPWVRIPSTPSTLFQFVLLKLQWENNENKNKKRPGLAHFKKKTIKKTKKGREAYFLNFSKSHKIRSKMLPHSTRLVVTATQSFSLCPLGRNQKPILHSPVDREQKVIAILFNGKSIR